MNYTYHFTRTTGFTTIDKVIDWCSTHAGVRDIDWEIWILPGRNPPGQPSNVGIKIQDCEVALAFELAFNVKRIMVDEDVLTKYID